MDMLNISLRTYYISISTICVMPCSDYIYEQTIMSRGEDGGVLTARWWHYTIFLTRCQDIFLPCHREHFWQGVGAISSIVCGNRTRQAQTWSGPICGQLVFGPRLNQHSTELSKHETENWTKTNVKFQCKESFQHIHVFIRQVLFQHLFWGLGWRTWTLTNLNQKSRTQIPYCTILEVLVLYLTIFTSLQLRQNHSTFYNS